MECCPISEHWFLIFTEPNGKLPDDARSYLKVLKPSPIYPIQQVFNFTWILGRNVSDENVRELNELLEVSLPA